jgi:hypothetical protein
MPPIMACLGYGYFALCKPDKLQSEEYQLRHETLELIRQKGAHLPVSSASLDIVANPIAEDSNGGETA